MIYDLGRRGALSEVFRGTREAFYFGLEFALGIAVPLVLLTFPAVRRNTRSLYAAGLLVVIGFVVNRLNVSLTGLEGALGGHYVPAVPEIVVTLMLVAGGFALFALAAKHLPVFAGPEEPGLGAEPVKT